ncbi:MAG: J domain-containing protein [Bacteroidota bacterium]
MDDLKRMFYKLAQTYHPDKGGSTEQFQELQNEYESLQTKILNGGSFTEEEKQNEQNISDLYKDIINLIIFINGITIEIVGTWVWIGGATYPVREELKAAGFTFAGKKKMWYWHAGEFRKYNNKTLAMDDIRHKYGSEKINPKQGNYLRGIGSVGSLSSKLKKLQSLLIAKQRISGINGIRNNSKLI